jgi:hypothetical protein
MAWRVRPLTPSALDKVDGVAILTDHSAFDYDSLVVSILLIIETRNPIAPSWV